MKKVVVILMCIVFCMSTFSFAALAGEPAPEGAAIAEGESPAGESQDAQAEGESAEGESGGASAGGSGGSADPMQDIILTEGEETYENVDWAGTGGYLALLGATAYVGGEADNYEVTGFLVPVTESYFADSAVQFDGAVNSVFTGTQDATGGGATFNVTGEGSALYARNIYATSQGSQTAAMYVDETNNKLVVQDSYIESFGSLPGYEEVQDFIALQGLLAWGHTRTNLSQGTTNTYYYNSAVVADGWAAMSTDGATGLGVNFVAVNSYAETADGGYAIYSDHECRDYIFGTTLVGAEYGAIVAAGGELYLLDGQAIDMENTELNGWRTALLEQYQPNLMNTSYQDFAGEHPIYALEEYVGEKPEVGRTKIVGGRNCVLLHKPDEQHEGVPAATQNVLVAINTDFVVDYHLFNVDDMPEGWMTPDCVTSSASMFYPDTLNYAIFTGGPAILLRSCSSLIVLDNVTYESNYKEINNYGQQDGFIMSILNSDGNANLIPDGEVASPIDIYISNSEITGNILHMDYQRAMNINLDNTKITGRIDNIGIEKWNQIMGEGGFVGQGTYQYDDSYETFWAPVLTMTNGSVWEVNDNSFVKELYIDETSEIIGEIIEEENGYTIKPLGAADGDSPEGESPEGESPEGESPEGESDGESAEGESEGESDSEAVEDAAAEEVG